MLHKLVVETTILLPNDIFFTISLFLPSHKFSLVCKSFADFYDEEWYHQALSVKYPSSALWKPTYHKFKDLYESSLKSGNFCKFSFGQFIEPMLPIQGVKISNVTKTIQLILSFDGILTVINNVVHKILDTNVTDITDNYYIKENILYNVRPITKHDSLEVGSGEFVTITAVFVGDDIFRSLSNSNQYQFVHIITKNYVLRIDFALNDPYIICKFNYDLKKIIATCYNYQVLGCNNILSSLGQTICNVKEMYNNSYVLEDGTIMLLDYDEQYNKINLQEKHQYGGCVVSNNTRPLQYLLILDGDIYQYNTKNETLNITLSREVLCNQLNIDLTDNSYIKSFCNGYIIFQ